MKKGHKSISTGLYLIPMFVSFAVTIFTSLMLVFYIVASFWDRISRIDNPHKPALPPFPVELMLGIIVASTFIGVFSFMRFITK